MTDSIETLLQKLQSLQNQGGLFSSFRVNKYLFYKRPDTNVFITASIVFILQNLKKYLSEKHNFIIDEISAKAIKNYPDFQNKDGLKTYNFWKTKPSQHFPDGFIFKYLEHFRIPDDIDDTALIYLTLPHLKEDVLWLKDKVIQHSNLEKTQIKNTFQHYKNLKVYSTWFGKNMPIEFDVCALCNLMFLCEKHQIQKNGYDLDTYKFLKEVIEREEFINFPFRVSHNYATTPLIIYHYARLLGEFEIKELENCREKIIETAKKLLKTEQNLSNQILLETSLSKLEVRSEELRVEKKYSELGTRNSELTTHNSQLSTHNSELNSTFFIAGLLSSYENPILQNMASWKITQMEWKSEALDLALLLENLVLKKPNPLLPFG